MPETETLDAALGWINGLIGPDSAVTSAHPLLGGTHARTYLVNTEHPTDDVVLRMFPEGDSAAAREALVLSTLDGLGGLAPRLLASDAEGSVVGRPATLISRLHGTADIRPANPMRWAAELGRALARVHSAPTERLGRLPRLLDVPGGRPGHVSGPAAEPVTAAWDELRAAPDVLTHYDFWSGNVIWDAGAVSGVVDWSGATVGPASYDLGWCRLDLVLLYDESIADAMLAAYATALGTGPIDPLLADLWAAARSRQGVETWAPNYLELDRTDLDATALRRLHTEWTEHLVARSTRR